MKIAIMGTGGIGGYFGGSLAHAGLDVTFIARGHHLQAIRVDGLQVQSPNGDFDVKPAKATDHPAEVGVVDVILFCVKTYDVEQAAEQMRPLIGAQTVILPVLNGIDHIEKLSALIGAEHVLGGIVACGSHIAAPGVIHHTSFNTITFGEMGGGMSARCEAIQKAFTVHGVEMAVVPNVVHSLWQKLTNLSGLGVCSVVRGGYHVVRSAPETLELVRQAAQETVALAHAKGIAVPDTMPADLVKLFREFPLDFKPSMLVDLEHGRRLEVEWLNGTVSRLGKAVGVPTPVNDYIYASLKPWANGKAQ